MTDNNESFGNIYRKIVSVGLKNEFTRESERLILWTHHLGKIIGNANDKATNEFFTGVEKELADLKYELVKKGILSYLKNFEELYKNRCTHLNSFIFSNKMNLYKRNESTETAFNGLCFINNNFKLGKNTREGSDEEAEKLEEIFKLLNYNVIKENNLNKKHLKKKIEELKSKDLDNYDSFIGFFMSHGDKKYFQCCDYVIKYKHIINMFNNENFPGLANKPKVLFFICCRGDKKDEGIETDEVKDKEISKKIPLQSDILIVYSTYDGYASPRNKQKGSYFGNCLIKVLEELIENPCMVKEIHDILKETSAKLIQERYHLKEQENLISSFEFNNCAFNKDYYLGVHSHLLTVKHNTN